MKLLRTIRLDASDDFVFERAAAHGEWAVSGAFAFWDGDPAALTGKARAAFRSGFLGVASLGWSTLVEIVEASADEHAAVVDALAAQLVAGFGAPDLDQARVAAREEIGFASALCEHPVGSLIAVHRRLDQGEIREAFRTLRPRPGLRPVFGFVAGDDPPADDGGGETVDLVDLARERRP
ncbi:MAG: hypothetical protein HY060_12995 [Proteobacteria bacterium]|nr:hypothetical protein [Pseudomonadota bacterium]